MQTVSSALGIPEPGIDNVGVFSYIQAADLCIAQVYRGDAVYHVALGSTRPDCKVNLNASLFIDYPVSCSVTRRCLSRRTLLTFKPARQLASSIGKNHCIHPHPDKIGATS